jgi:MFS family permease
LKPALNFNAVRAAPQGLCTGGEAGAVVTYISEQANRGTKGIMVACVGGSQNLAYGLAASVVWLMRMSLTEEQMVMWGWRVPFLLSAVPAYFCLSRLSQMEVRVCVLRERGAAAVCRRRNCSEQQHASYMRMMRSHRTCCTLNRRRRRSSNSWG